MRAKSILEEESSGWVDLEDGGMYFRLLYKHQTSEDDWEIDEERLIDPYDMNIYIGLKKGLNLKEVDDDALINIKNIEKIDNEEWLLKTNVGDIKLTLAALEKLADTTQKRHLSYRK